MVIIRADPSMDMPPSPQTLFYLCYRNQDMGDMINNKLWLTFTLLNKDDCTDNQYYYYYRAIKKMSNVFDKSWEPAVIVALSLSVTVSMTVSLSVRECETYGLTL